MTFLAQNPDFHAVSESLRSSVWNAMYENELVSRYYQALLRKHNWWDKLLRFFTLLAALLMVGVSIAAPAVWMKVVSTVPFLGIYFTDAKIRFIKVGQLTRIVSGSSVIGSMLKSLWREMELGALREDAVKFMMTQIEAAESALVSRYIDEGKFTEDRELNIRCAEESKQVMINFYQGASA